MQCPHCQHAVELTWMRYLANPLGRHICPVCSTTFELKAPLAYKLDLLVLCLVCVGIPFIHAMVTGGNLIVAFLVGAIFYLAIAIPLDKHHDASQCGAPVAERARRQP